MVVKHYDGFTEPEQFRAVRNAGFIYIHYYKDGIIPYHLNCLLPIDNQVIIIIRVIMEHIHKRLQGSARIA